MEKNKNIINVNHAKFWIWIKNIIHDSLKFQLNIFQFKWHYIPFILTKKKLDLQFYNDLFDEYVFFRNLISYQILKIQIQIVIFATNLSCLELDSESISKLYLKVCSLWQDGVCLFLFQNFVNIKSHTWPR